MDNLPSSFPLRTHETQSQSFRKRNSRPRTNPGQVRAGGDAEAKETARPVITQSDRNGIPLAASREDLFPFSVYSTRRAFSLQGGWDPVLRFGQKHKLNNHRVAFHGGNICLHTLLKVKVKDLSFGAFEINTRRAVMQMHSHLKKKKKNVYINPK